MLNKSIRLNQETQGTVAEEGHRRILKLPQGCEIALIGPVDGHTDMVEVNWDRQVIWIFAIDFEERTAPAVTEQKTLPTPRVRRFNAAGRELF